MTPTEHAVCIVAKSDSLRHVMPRGSCCTAALCFADPYHVMCILPAARRTWHALCRAQDTAQPAQVASFEPCRTVGSTATSCLHSANRTDVLHAKHLRRWQAIRFVDELSVDDFLWTACATMLALPNVQALAVLERCSSRQGVRCLRGGCVHIQTSM